MPMATQVGATASRSRTISTRDIELFTELTGDRNPHGPGRRPAEPFSRDELVAAGDRPGGSELDDATATGRRLENAGRIPVRPTTDFVDRVMEAVAREPLPAPAPVAKGASAHSLEGNGYPRPRRLGARHQLDVSMEALDLR